MSSSNFNTLDSYYTRTINIPDGNGGQFDFEYSLSNPIATQNLYTLFTRKQGASLYVDHEGRLAEVESISERIWAWFKGPDKTRQVVTQTLRELNRILSHLQDDRTRLVVQHFFSPDGKIGQLGNEIFNRQDFKGDDILSRLLMKKQVIRLAIGNVGFFDVESNKVEDSAILNIDLGTKESNQNLLLLLSRQKGTIFSERTEVIQNVARDVICRLEAFLKRSEITDIHRIAIKKIFEEGAFHNLNSHLFRESVKKKTVSPFCDIAEGSEIEKIIKPKYQATRDKFKATFHLALQEIITLVKKDVKELMKTERLSEEEARKCVMKDLNLRRLDGSTLRILEEALMDFVMMEAKFMRKLGGDLEHITSGGSGGARAARDRYGREILVVKPGDEGPTGINNPTWHAWFKRQFLPQRRSLFGNSEPLAEVESWLLDRFFGLYVVPPTQLRYVKSKQFNGHVRKECSVQMWVSGCKALGKSVGIASWMYRLPRESLRWFAGKKGKKKGDAILAAIPKGGLERIACHDAITGNSDCHLDNILTKKQGPQQEKAIVEKLIENDVINEELLDQFVSKFFEQRNHQKMLDELLYSEENKLGEKVWCIVPDGGSSCGHSQPNGYLSLAFKYLFEILPHFEEPFSLQHLFVGKENQFVKAVAESTIQSLRNILQHDWFLRFWQKEENRKHLKNWMFATGNAEQTHRTFLIGALWQATGLNSTEDFDYYTQKYFPRHLLRIGGNLETRMQNWRVFNKNLVRDQPMRKFFDEVRSDTDIQRELFELKDLDGFSQLQASWRDQPVKPGEAVYRSAEHLDMNKLLDDFGAPV